MAKKFWMNGLALAGVAMILTGCHTDMWRQEKAMPQTPSNFFADGTNDRPTIEGTVPKGHLKTESERFAGRDPNGKLLTALPSYLVIDGERLSTATDLKKIIERGHERYMIACQHCHGELGDGQGMIAKRGFALRRPVASYHTDRLRQMPIGHFYEVMTKGYGVMFSQAPRVEPDDRWAIAAFIRALQLSQHPMQPGLPEEDRKKLEEQKQQNTRTRPRLG